MYIYCSKCKCHGRERNEIFRNISQRCGPWQSFGMLWKIKDWLETGEPVIANYILDDCAIDVSLYSSGTMKFELFYDIPFSSILFQGSSTRTNLKFETLLCDNNKRRNSREKWRSLTWKTGTGSRSFNESFFVRSSDRVKDAGQKKDSEPEEIVECH